MKEFTLRNKNSNNPIFTLSKKVMDSLKARPKSGVLVLAKYKRDYSQLTGKKPNLDYEQNQVLLKHCGANESGMWISKYSGLDSNLTVVKNCFQDGFLNMTISNGMLIDLKVVESFFNLLEQSIKTNIKLKD